EVDERGVADEVDGRDRPVALGGNGAHGAPQGILQDQGIHRARPQRSPRVLRGALKLADGSGVVKVTSFVTYSRCARQAEGDSVSPVVPFRAWTTASAPATRACRRAST